MNRTVLILFTLALVLITSCPESSQDSTETSSTNRPQATRPTSSEQTQGTPIASAKDDATHTNFNKMVGNIKIEDLGIVSKSKLAIGSPPPNFTFAYNGQVMSLSELKGKAVLINIFASWCPPCNHEMPDLQKAYEDYKNKDLVIIAVSTDSEIKEAKEFYTKYKLTMPVVPGADAGMSIGTAYNVTGIPTSIFVDKSGNVVDIHIGMLDANTLRAKIAKIL